jgi:transcriptional regulator with XRE-family HTH domain
MPTATPTRKSMSPLTQKRLALDLTQPELGAKVGVGAATISAWETGVRTPRAGQYRKLAEALGITPVEVVELFTSK